MLQSVEGGCSLNDILAKGTNNTNRLVKILFTWTIRKQGFYTDIQEMYNSVRLEKSHWYYQMYLWHDDLDMNNPKWKVIKTLLYGVKSSDNQAECGLRITATLLESKYARASEVVHKDVDDCLSGKNTSENVRTTTDELKLVLKVFFYFERYNVFWVRPARTLE